MRGWHIAGGVGVGLALVAGPGFGQEERAARLRLIKPAEEAPVARGQVGESTPLPPAKPLPGGSVGPTVTVTPGTAPPPAAALTYPGYPQTYPQTYPGVVVGQPVPGTPTYGTMVGPTPPAVLPTARPPLFAGGPALDAPLYGPGSAGTGTALGTGTGVPTELLTGRSRLKLDAELLLWWVGSQRIPALISTSSPAYNGILGQGDSRVVYGNDTLNSGLQTGGRFGATYYFGDDQKWGVQGDIFFLGRSGKSFSDTSATDAVVARPFFNINQGIPFSQLVAAPGLSVGGVAVTSSTQLWGAQVNVVRSLSCDPCKRFELFGGFRYLSFNDTIQIDEGFTRTPDSQLGIGVPTAVSGTVSDRFRTENHFYGPQLGLVREVTRGRWGLEGKVSLAMGTVFQSAKVDGSQLIQTTAGPQYFTGGLLALPGATIGSYSQTRFGVLPEAGVKLSYQVTPRAKLGVGYNFLYLSSVVRAGDQIDSAIDVTKIPNFPLPGTVNAVPPRGYLPLRTTDMFAQGISFSLQYSW